MLVKKISLAFIAALLLFSLASCGEGGDSANYTITYDASGGVVSSTTQDVTVGKTFSLATAEKTGYEFLGWYNGTAKMSGGTWSKKENVTLTAKWKAITYEITYVDCPDVLINALFYTVEDEITLAAPEKEGFAFTGWTYEGQDTPVVDLTIQKGEYGNKTFTANWTSKSYTITYDTTGGAIFYQTQAVEFDSIEQCVY